METTTLDDFLSLRQQLKSSESTAKSQMQDQFNELLTKAAELQNQYKDIFGGKLSLPKTVKTFTVEIPSPKSKKTNGKKPESENVNGKKIGALKRALSAQQAKLATATAAGDEKAVKNIGDRIYEIEDELKQLGVAIAETPTPAPAGETGLDLG